MAESKYTAPNDFRAFCEMLGETETSMCHHGIPGQRWGVRRFQDKTGKLTSLGRKRYGYGEAKEMNKENKQDNAKTKAMTDKFEFNKEYTLRDPLVKKAIANAKKFDENRNRTYDMHVGESQTRKEMLASIGVAPIVGASAGAYVSGLNPIAIGASAIGTTAVHAGVVGSLITKAAVANHKLNKTVKQIDANTNIDKATGLKLKNKTLSPDQDMAIINPAFKNLSENTKSNCLVCTTTYALRRQGYDVIANGANEGYDRTTILQAFPKTSMKIIKPGRVPFSKEGQKEFIEKLGIPEGGYGNIGVNWKVGGGHSMIYSVENGKPVIRDCQTNESFKGTAINKILSNSTGDVTVMRLDNAKPDIKYMKKAGLINPAGQAFDVSETPNVSAPTTTSNRVSEEKHGDTGIISALNKFQQKKEVAYAINRVAKQQMKLIKKVPNKAYGAEQFGFENDFTISNAAILDGKLKALYKTNTKTKSGNDVMVVVGADASSNDSNLRDITTHTQSASQIVKNEASVTSQAKKAIANAKDDYAREYYSKSDLQNMAKSLKINRIEVNNGTEHPNVIFEAMSNPKDGYTELFDCSFRTLPNGKVILVDTRTGRDWF